MANLLISLNWSIFFYQITIHKWNQRSEFVQRMRSDVISIESEANDSIAMDILLIHFFSIRKKKKKIGAETDLFFSPLKSHALNVSAEKVLVALKPILSGRSPKHNRAGETPLSVETVRSFGFGGFFSKKEWKIQQLRATMVSGWYIKYMMTWFHECLRF